MIYQTDKEFPNDINHFGCYFISLMFQLNRVFNIPKFEHQAIIDIYNHEIIDLDLGAECFMEKPQQICDFVLGPGKVRYNDTIYNRYRICQSNEFAIQCWYNPITSFHHFVAEGTTGRVVYDPIEGGSRTVREGHLDSKRIYTIL